MNKMADFAKLLGKELDEEFIVKAETGNQKCKLTNEGLLVHVLNSPGSPVWVNRNGYLYELIAGKYEIKSLPWKAKKLEEYYVPDPSLSAMYRKTKNIECCEDSVAYKRGFMCKTQEQAVMIARAIIEVACKMQGFDDMEDA